MCAADPPPQNSSCASTEQMNRKVVSYKGCIGKCSLYSIIDRLIYVQRTFEQTFERNSYTKEILGKQLLL